MMAVTGLQIQRSGSHQKKMSDFLQAGLKESFLGSPCRPFFKSQVLLTRNRSLVISPVTIQSSSGAERFGEVHGTALIK